MKPKSKFILVFAIAAVTFGTLFATVGPRHFKHCSIQKEHCIKQENAPVQQPPAQIK